MSEYKEIIVKEYHNEKGLTTRREIGEELVRCKDCKYWNDAGLCKKHSNPIVGAIYGTDADDYCSEGERKDPGHGKI